MTSANKVQITVQTTVNVPVEKVWELWTLPEHIIHWNTGSPDWHTPYAENDLRVGGKALSRMQAKDGSASFDFVCIYDEVELHRSIAFTMEDGRKARVTFTGSGKMTTVSETFDAETENSVELQREGWQTIMNNFKNYAESVN